MSNDEMAMRSFWGPRAASLDEATQQVTTFLEAVTALGPPYDALFVYRDRPRDPVVPARTDATFVRDLLYKGRIFDDTRRWMPQLGYMAMLNENRRQFWQAGVEVLVGCTSPRVSNLASLQSPLGALRDADHEAQLLGALEAAVHVFDPDEAAIQTGDMLNTRPGTSGLAVGWISYLPPRVARRAPMPLLPDGVTVEPYAGGLLIRLTQEWFDLANDDHRRRLLQTDALLRAAGILPPATA